MRGFSSVKGIVGLALLGSGFIPMLVSVIFFFAFGAADAASGDEFDYFAIIPVVVPGSIGLAICLVGVGVLVSARRDQEAKRQLREKGREVKARFLQVDRDHAITINGQPAWVVVAEYTDPFRGGHQFFRSDPLWNDPTALASRQPFIRVFVDPADPGRYEMDVDFLG